MSTRLSTDAVSALRRLRVLRLRKQHRRLSKHVNTRRVRPERKNNSVTIQTISVLFVLAKAMRADKKDSLI